MSSKSYRNRLAKGIWHHRYRLSFALTCVVGAVYFAILWVAQFYMSHWLVFSSERRYIVLTSAFGRFTIECHAYDAPARLREVVIYRDIPTGIIKRTFFSGSEREAGDDMSVLPWHTPPGVDSFLFEFPDRNTFPAILMERTKPSLPTKRFGQGTQLGIFGVYFWYQKYMARPYYSPPSGSIAWCFEVPAWMPVSLLMLAATWLGRPIFIHAHRSSAGLCLACGYDLRASPNRCPECGHDNQKASLAADLTAS